VAEDAAGPGRRDLLKRALALGAAAPLTTVLTRPLGATRTRRAAALSSLQLAGQRVIYSYSGLTVPAALLQAITAGQAAGVIFFGGNISSDTQIASAIQQLVQAQQQSPVSVPLLLMTDQEGGEVRRLPGAPTLSEKQIGASSNPTLEASQAGTGAGQNLAGVGMNVNLAPVLDVYYKSGNFIDQYQRSYSNKASVVTQCGQAFITAQQQTGVAATAKHFPGLGSATKSQNTDNGPVTLNVSLSGLRGKDEVPYPAAITAGVKLVMVVGDLPRARPDLPGRAFLGLGTGRTARSARLRRGHDHRRDRGRGADLIRKLRAARRPRGPGRDGPVAVLGAGSRRRPGSHLGAGERPGQRAAELGRFQRLGPAGNCPSVSASPRGDYPPVTPRLGGSLSPQTPSARGWPRDS